MRMLRYRLVAAGITATLVVGVAVDRGSHSVSDTLYGAFVPVLLIWLAVGAGLILSGRMAARS